MPSGAQYQILSHEEAAGSTTVASAKPSCVQYFNIRVDSTNEGGHTFTYLWSRELESGRLMFLATVYFAVKFQVPLILWMKFVKPFLPVPLLDFIYSGC